MSGGSYDHAYYRVQDMADKLCESKCPRRRAFAAHLVKVAKAMHAVEWVDSSDWGHDRDVAPIMEVIEPGDVLSETVKQAQAALAELQKALNAVEVGRG